MSTTAKDPRSEAVRLALRRYTAMRAQHRPSQRRHSRSIPGRKSRLLPRFGAPDSVDDWPL